MSRPSRLPPVRAEWLATAARPGQFPAPAAPEIAFLGRSNVGKSSLLNALVARRGLARTSSTPGKTRLLHWFRIERSGRELWFVDLPGYGYAKVSRSEREQWKGWIESYLGGRSTLRLAVLLQDLRREPGDDEALLLAWLAERGVPAAVALTKCDKLKPMRRAERVRVLRRAPALAGAPVFPTSAQNRDGLGELWDAIESACSRPTD